jgi:hypothetical protein
MADAEDRGQGEKPTRKRSMKPEPGVIDAEAEEIGREPPPDPVAEQTAPESDDDMSEAEPRSPLGALVAAGLAGAVIAIVLLMILLASELIPLRSDDPALGSRVAELEAVIAQGGLDRPPPTPIADDSALRSELAALKQQVADLRAAPPAGASPDTALQARVDEMSARLDAVTKLAEERTDTAALDRLSARIDELAAKAAEPPPPDPSVQAALAGSRSTAALAAVSALESAVSRGAPYAAALAAVQGHIPGASVGALENGAGNGLQSANLLADRLSAKLENAPSPPSRAEGFVERLTEGARELVRVRPVDGTVPVISADDPWSARNAVLVRLDQRDFSAALADWEKLDPAAQAATKAEAEALKARLAADTALDELRAAALGVRAETTP